MSSYELKHKWELSRKSWYVRLFLFVWIGVKEEQITFCKMFWGYVFMPIGLLIDLVILMILGVVWPFAHMEEKYKERKSLAASLPTPPAPPKAEKKEKTPSKFLIAVENFFAKLGMGISSLWFKTEKVRGWIVQAAVIFGGLVAVAAVVLLVYLLLTTNIAWLALLKWVGIVLGVAVLVVLISWLLITGVGKWKVYKAKQAPREKTGPPRFITVLWQGYVAVKTNTCPQIVLKD